MIQAAPYLASIIEAPKTLLRFRSLRGLALVAAGTPHTLADANGLGPFQVSWSADGVPIAGATGFSFTPTQAQVGRVIRARISYSDGLGYTSLMGHRRTDAQGFAG